MKRLFSLILTLVILNLASLAFCAVVTNTVNLTSYYPAPFGAYERLRLVPRADLAGPCADNGTIYFRASNNSLQLCANNVWGPFTSLWSMTSTPGLDQYYFTTPYPDLTTNKPYLGIGTQDPQRPLHIVVDNPGTPEAVIIENLSTTPNSGANISYRGMKQGVPMQEYVALQAIYQNLTNAAAESSLSIYLRDGTGSGRKEQFTFKGKGFMGIREPDPAAVLEIAGDGITALMMISSNQLVANNGNVLTVLNNGNVGINKKLPTQKLEVTGNVKATMLILTSDASLKKDIQPLTHALDKISQIKGVSFEWKDNSNDQRQHMGVLAQDVEKIFPESVYGEDGAKGVDYPSLIAPLIEAVKELKRENETLGQQLQEQSRQIDQHDQEIELLQNSFSAKKPALAP